MSRGWGRTITLVVAVVVALVMVFSALAAANVVVKSIQTHSTPAVSTDASTPWTYPTTTMEEPNYTGGTYITAATVDVEYLNVWKTSDLYSFMLLDELYDSLDVLAPNQTYIPWAAASYTESTAPVGTTTFDPLTGMNASVAYEWTVTLRPGIEWSDWPSSGGASSTYAWSDHYDFSLWNATSSSVDSYSYTYPWASVPMNTYTMQSADLIWSWLLMVTSADYSSAFANIVNVIPTSNLTAVYMLSAQSASFVTTTLGAPVVPFHVWKSHDCAYDTDYAWNYTGYPSGVCGSETAANAGYDVWNVGYNPATGLSNDLIGSGPFMFTNSYGEPAGSWVVGDYWELFVNPHYFVQYFPTLEQYSPKIYELYTPLYLSESDAVTAFLLGQVDTVLNGVDPTYIPTIDTDPNSFIFYQPSGAFNFIQINSWGNYTPIPGTSFAPDTTNAPFNITSVRQALNYATDKAYLASVVAEGYLTLGQPVIPPSDSIWHNFTANQYSYNPTLAIQMLGAVPGMTKVGNIPGGGHWDYNGVPVSLNIETTVASADPLGVEGDEVVANEWTAVGIPTTVTQEAFASLLPPLFDYGYSGISLGITGISGDPTGYLIEVYNASIGLGSGFYNGPFSSLTWNGTAYTGYQIDALMGDLTTQLNSITNLAQRIALADEIEGIADEESVIINTGYPITILPFDNATYTGLEENSLPYSSYMYFNYLSFELKTPTKVIPPSTVPAQLKVGVVAPTTVFTDNQTGNLTIQVRNQYGQPEAGMNVEIGYLPEGMLLNISSDSGTTSAAGSYTWEFQVLSTNAGTFTADYGGQVNITVAATPPAADAKTILAGIGWTHIDVAPQPVAFTATDNTDLSVGGAQQPLRIMVYNPLTGNPIPGYAYTVEALQGAVNLTSTSSSQSVQTVSDYLLPFGFGYQSVLVNGAPDYDLTAISGVTGSNGTIAVLAQQNESSNLSANGNPFQTWLFVGAYQATATVPGVPPYGSIGEVTSSFDALANGDGYGVLEPAEIPLTISSDPAVSISLAVSSSSTGPSGSITVTATVTNSTTGAPVGNATVTVYAQNDFGANRGYLSNETGTDVAVYNPNVYFASTFLPGLQMTTAPDGVAISTFSPGLYTAATPGGVLTYEAQPYTDSYLIPADMWELAAYVTNSTGAINSTTADTQITSTQLSTPATPSPVAAAYIAGSVISLSGTVSVSEAQSYALYINTTEDSPAGPVAAGVDIISVTTTLGTVTPASGTTSSAGLLLATLTVPTVTTPSEMVITIEYAVGTGTANATETVYVVPTLGVKTTTTAANLDLYYALIGIFAVLTVIFAALWVSARGRKIPPMPGTMAGGGGSTQSTMGSGGMPPSSSSGNTGMGGPGSGPPGGS